MDQLSRRRAVGLSIGAGACAAGLLASKRVQAAEITGADFLAAIEQSDPKGAEAADKAYLAFEQAQAAKEGPFRMEADANAGDQINKICEAYQSYVKPILVVILPFLPKKYRAILTAFMALIETICTG